MEQGVLGGREMEETSCLGGKRQVVGSRSLEFVLRRRRCKDLCIPHASEHQQQNDMFSQAIPELIVKLPKQW